ncbi:MAG: alpha/beta fold hydrolase [Ignavibacteriales bacterium]|nr:alpha/beta fold hydrolase [Ignavibacteriales bacterium]
MQLFYQQHGDAGVPLIILHGLLGSSDNWHTHAKLFGRHFRVFALDARNHGRSPHEPVFNYHVMAEDVHEFIQQHRLGAVHLLGHSMGGKTAMFLATLYPDAVEKLIVVDIAPKASSPSHDEIFDALEGLDLSRYAYRKEIDEALSKRIPNFFTRQFVLKNLRRNADNSFDWKMNLDAIRKNHEGINAAVPNDRIFSKPTLFIKGGNSRYILESDILAIHEIFPSARIATIAEAGHWVHSDAPDPFASVVLDFLKP